MRYLLRNGGVQCFVVGSAQACIGVKSITTNTVAQDDRKEIGTRIQKGRRVVSQPIPYCAPRNPRCFLELTTKPVLALIALLPGNLNSAFPLAPGSAIEENVNLSSELSSRRSCVLVADI